MARRRQRALDDDKITVEGEVTAVSRGRMITVRLGNGHTAICTPCGKMQVRKIKILPEDRVQVELSPYDLSRGRITYRFK
jgi:translation initiation factor IF-1